MLIQANAKLNLTLDVLSRRPDGYHDMRMIMQSITLADELTISPLEWDELRVSTNLHFLPNNEKNLAAQAALRYWQARGVEPRGLDITIHKRIPVCAGMAGGSSDAAAVLRALNQMDPDPLAGPGGGDGGLRCALLRAGGDRPGRGKGRGADPAAPSAKMLGGGVQARLSHLHPRPFRGH